MKTNKFALIIFSVLLLFCIACIVEVATAEEYQTAYVICMPGDRLNVRPSPSKKGDPIGYLEPGDTVYLDGKKKNGFYHCVDMCLEDNEGWVHSGYIVFDEPVLTNQNATIVSKGRLAARKYVGGKRTRWLKPLASVYIYYWSEEWCLTNCGYLQARFLELEGV